MAGTSALPSNLGNLPNKGAFVRQMFGRIAPRYDLMNRLMTASLDWHWRRALLGEIALPPGGKLLDLATGTGDVAWLTLQRVPTAFVVGADFSWEMIAAGKRLNGRRAIHWQQSDALWLPFPDNCFDAVTSAFLIRNLSQDQLLPAFTEQARALKPGGKVVCLDITPPPQTLFAPVIRRYMSHVIPAIGWLVAGDRAAYHYLAVSAAQFKTAEALAALMAEAGLQVVRFRRLMFGAVTLLVGEKRI